MLNFWLWITYFLPIKHKAETTSIAVQSRQTSRQRPTLHKPVKTQKTIGWESIKSRAEVLGLSVYNKKKLKKKTMRLIQQRMTSPDNILYNLRNNGNKRLRHPYLGQKFEN